LPQPGDVTPQKLYPDALAEVEQAREKYAFALEAQHDDLQEDPLLIALGNARGRPPAAPELSSSSRTPTAGPRSPGPEAKRRVSR
jgi:hypothetical protein